MASFGDLLKHWRKTRRMSQLDLALAADVSSRHISFLESGRSKPSRPMITRICETLQMPLSSRNVLLNAAGFTSHYQVRPLGDDAMKAIGSAIEWTIEHHAPYPAVVLDRKWIVIRANRPAEIMLGAFGLTTNSSLLDAICDPVGIRQNIENWDQVCRFLITRLRLENDHFGGDQTLENAIISLERTLEPDQEWRDETGPILPMTLVLGDHRLSVFSTIAQFGSAEDLALSEYRLEYYFPNDEPTRQLFLSWNKQLE